MRTDAHRIQRRERQALKLIRSAMRRFSTNRWPLLSLCANRRALAPHGPGVPIRLFL
jgi:hypothetical protein